MLQDFLELVAATVVSGVIGGGMLIALFRRALVSYLSDHFATKSELNGVGTRVNALETVAIGAREVADEANASIARLEVVQQQHWERVAEHVVKPLEKVTERLQEVAESQAAQAATMKLILQRTAVAQEPT